MIFMVLANTFYSCQFDVGNSQDKFLLSG